MSLVKNTTSSDTAMTIVKFERGQNIKKYVDDSSEYIGVYPRYYLELSQNAIGKNSNQPDIFNVSAGDTVIMKCEFSSNTGGPIFGAVESESNNFFILVNSGEEIIQWYIDGTVVATATFTTGIHLIGWKGLEVNGNKRSQPWYDGDYVSGSQPQNFTERHICLGGAYTGQGASPWGADFIRLYEVVAEIQSSGSWHLYPCDASISSNSVRHTMFDAINRTPHRVKYTLGGSGSSATTADFPEIISGVRANGFGVQLFDLKTVTGSGYNDLFAIITEDSSRPVSGAGPADHVQKTDNTDQRNFAFRLADGSVGSTISNAIPVPTGYKVARDNQESIIAYIKGDLILGRTPKWNLWNDGIKFGKYIRTQNQEDASASYYAYNIFKDSSGADSSDLLGRFAGYNTYSGANHAPNFDVSTTMNAEFHNGVMASCTTNDNMTSPTYECYRIYKYNADSMFKGKVNIGNLAPWNMTREEVYGLHNTLNIRGASINVVYKKTGQSPLKIADVVFRGVGSDYFNEDSSIDMATFRDGNLLTEGISLNEDMRYVIYAVAKKDVSLGGVMNCTARLGLLGLDDSSIHVENVVPRKNVDVSVSFDPNYLTPYPGSTGGTFNYNNKDRFLVGENGGKCTIDNQTYELRVMSRRDNVQVWEDFPMEYKYPNQASQFANLGRGIGCTIGVWNGSQLINIANTNPIIAYIDAVLVNDNGNFYARYGAFTKPMSLDTTSYSGEWSWPFIISGPSENFGLDSETPSRIWPGGRYEYAPGGYSQLLACIFRWKQLYHNTTDASLVDASINAYPYYFRPMNNGTPVPLTSHIRIFENSSNHPGPVAWSLYYGLSDSNFGWDSSYGMPYQRITISGTTYRFYVALKDSVMPFKRVESGLDSSYTPIVDCWYSVFDSTGTQQITNMNNMPSTFSFSLYETPLHEPQKRKGMVEDSTASEIVPTLVATMTLPNTNTTYDSTTGLAANISAKSIYQDYAILPNGTGGFNMNGFFHFKCYMKCVNYSPGTYYQIVFSA